MKKLLTEKPKGTLENALENAFEEFANEHQLRVLIRFLEYLEARLTDLPANDRVHAVFTSLLGTLKAAAQARATKTLTIIALCPILLATALGLVLAFHGGLNQSVGVFVAGATCTTGIATVALAKVAPGGDQSARPANGDKKKPDR